MRELQSRDIRVRSDQVFAARDDLALVFRNVYLDPSLSIVCSAKTVSKAQANVTPTLFVTAGAKTVVLTVGVPNLVLSLVASAKTISAASLTMNVEDPQVHVTGSAKVVSRASVVVNLVSVAERIRRGSAVLITNPYYAKLVI